jgi:SPP1 gp7 family putative phage head morphogenesis protein
VSVYTAAIRYRRQVLAADKEARTDLIKAYGDAWRELKASLEEVTGLIERARTSGESVNSAWLARQDRYRSLLGQVSQEVQRIANLGAIMLPREQTEMVRLAQEHVAQLTRQQTARPAQDVGIAAGFNRINPEAVENIAGFLSDGSPLRSLLDELGPEASADVAAALKRSVILGESPIATARRVKGAFAGSMVRAVRISRTELLRSYREATHQSYLANRDILNGWMWLATLSNRTCPSCLALHGRTFPLEERMREHINGRCTQVPVVIGETLTVQRGEEWLAEQPEEVQRDVLGVQGQREYAAGNVALPDFVGVNRSVRWGANYQPRSLEGALAKHGQGIPTLPREREAPPRVSVPGPLVPPQPVAPPPPVDPGEVVRQKVLKAEEAHAAKTQRLQVKMEEAIQESIKVESEYWELASLASPLSQSMSEDARRARLSDLQARRTEHDAKIAQAQAAFQNADNQRLTTLRRALYAPKEQAKTTIPVKIVAKGYTAGQKRAVREGATFLERITAKNVLYPDIEVRPIDPRFYGGERSYQLGGHIYLSPGGRKTATVVHEIGHALENYSSSWVNSRTEWMAQRTAGEQARPLRELRPDSGYQADEVAKPDKFRDPYIGKVYADRGASEVFSMGLQYLYEDPGAFARKDPDMFRFIVRALR